jgi:hypothetical protein
MCTILAVAIASFGERSDAIIMLAQSDTREWLAVDVSATFKNPAENCSNTLTVTAFHSTLGSAAQGLDRPHCQLCVAIR